MKCPHCGEQFTTRTTPEEPLPTHFGQWRVLREEKRDDRGRRVVLLQCEGRPECASTRLIEVSQAKQMRAKSVCKECFLARGSGGFNSYKAIPAKAREARR